MSEQQNHEPEGSLDRQPNSDDWPAPDWLSPDDPVNKRAKEQEEQRKKDEEAWTNVPYDAFMAPDAPKSPLELGLKWGTDEWNEAQERRDNYVKDYFDKNLHAANESPGSLPPKQQPIDPGSDEEVGPARSSHEQHE